MRLSTREAAGRIGVSRNTLLRWFREGRVPDVRRDRNGWRFFTPDDIGRIKTFAERQSPPPNRSGAAHAPAPAPQVAV